MANLVNVTNRLCFHLVSEQNKTIFSLFRNNSKYILYTPGDYTLYSMT